MLKALWAIMIFLVVILIHELGHFTVAKLVGIKVNEFSIGMGPKIFQRKKGETQYTLRLLPIGGYVAMEGEEDSSDDPRSFSNAPVLSRILVVIAGAIMNFILAIVVFSIVGYGIGSPSTKVEEVMKDSPAEIAGILAGDRVVKIDGVDIDSWEDIVNNIENSQGKLRVSVEKENGEIKEVGLETEKIDGRNIIGIVPKSERKPGSAISIGFKTTWDMVKQMFGFLGMLFKGEVGTESLSGPVGVVKAIGDAAEMGIYNVLMFLGLISVNLGFFNLLPIPALDGSKVVFLIIEAIRGKAIDPNKEGMIHFVGFALLMTLMLFVTYKDIVAIKLLK